MSPGINLQYYTDGVSLRPILTIFHHLYLREEPRGEPMGGSFRGTPVSSREHCSMPCVKIHRGKGT